MASAAALGPYSRALALSNKSNELTNRGHAERSLDKLREALAAARAVGTEDCLVTAYLMAEVALHNVHSLVRLSRERPMTPLDRPSYAAKLREFAEAITGAAAVARRRRAAGTHTPAEQAWYEAHQVAGWRVQGVSESKALKDAKRLVPLSSDTTVLAAIALHRVLEVASKSAVFSARELSSRLDATCDLVDEAVALAGPQRVECTFSAFEGMMMNHLRAGVELWRQEISTAAHAERLQEALNQLSLHGIMDADDRAKRTQKMDKFRAKFVAAQAAATAPELLRCCALASCAAKEAHVKHFSRCSACKTVVYCSKTCQLADWPAHKKACKAARKAAEQAEAAKTA